MNEIIITAIVGVVCTALTSLVTWFLSKKKYTTEVEHNSIENMDNSLSFYERLSDSNNKILTEILARYEEIAKTNVELLTEVQTLRSQIGILVTVLQTEVDAVDFEKYGIQINTDGTISIMN